MAHVLIVEDDPVNAEVAAVICQAAGHTVAFAAQGEEALAQMERAHFDVLLLDVQMPVMDGLTLTRILRASPRWSHVPILGVTAKAGAEDQAAMAEAGMTRIITKPYRNSVLRDALQETLNQARHGSLERRVPPALQNRDADAFSA